MQLVSVLLFVSGCHRVVLRSFCVASFIASAAAAGTVQQPMILRAIVFLQQQLLLKLIVSSFAAAAAAAFTSVGTLNTNITTAQSWYHCHSILILILIPLKTSILPLNTSIIILLPLNSAITAETRETP